MQNRKRDSSIDVIKGIGIILLIIGHCIGFFQNQTEQLADDIVNAIINSFHMPLFFFVGGVLYRRKEPAKSVLDRVQSLCIPLIIFSIINGLLLLLVYGMDYIMTFSEERRTMLLQIMKLQGGWFLIAYFFTCVIYSMLDRGRLNIAFTIVCGLILALSVSHIDKNGMTSYVLTSFVGLFFYWYGVNVKRTIEPRLPNRVFCILIGMLLFAVCCASNIIFPNDIRMYSNSYGNGFLFVINAVLGCTGIYLIGKGISKQVVLEHIGKLSLPIMAVQFPVYIGLCNIIDAHESIEMFSRFPCCIALWAVTLATSTFIAQVVSHIFPAFAGKWRYKYITEDREALERLNSRN